MRVATSTGASRSQNSARGSSHPYLPTSPLNGSWLFSDSSEESSGSAGDSLLSDDGVHPISASINRGGRQPPRRLVLYPVPIGYLPPSVDEVGCPTVAQYLAVETSYINDHAPARRQKALLSYESMYEIAQVLANYNEPPTGRFILPTLPTTGIMATSAMRHWARSKFTLSHDGVVLCKGKQVLVREQFYSALCWAHLQSAHGGRDKTSHMLWRYTGVPKELIMRFVASCPTCIDKTTALRRTMMNTAAKAQKSETTADEPEETSELSDREPSPQHESVSLPPLRQMFSTLFDDDGDSDQLKMPPRAASVLDSPTNFSPAGSAFDEIPSPPQGYVSQHEGYAGVSPPSLARADVAPLDTLPALHHVLTRVKSTPHAPSLFDAQAKGWGYPMPRDDDNAEGTDDSCVSDDSASPSMTDYSSPPYTQTSARDALMFTWSAAPMQRQAATEGVGLSPPSSPLMREYAHLASPAFEESPSATARLLESSPVAGGGISGWSPSSASSVSPFVTYASQFPSSVLNMAPQLYETPLSRYSNRTFQERWEAMYSARNVDLSHLQALPPAHSLEGMEEYVIMVDDDSSISDALIVDGNGLASDAVHAEESAHGDGSPIETPSVEMQYAALGFVHKPIGRARAHSHSLGLALQTDFSAGGVPTPPLTATSVLGARSPVSPGLETPAHSLLMHMVSSYKSDNYASGPGKLEAVDEGMLPWTEGLPTKHDPLSPHNLLHDWINMDYLQEGEEQPKQRS